MGIAFLFPGQGSQAAGMGKALYDAFASAREVFQEVDEALKQKLSALIFSGPEAELNQTQNTQPALMAVSAAVVRVLEKDFSFPLDKAKFLAGHSLGEYSALAAAGFFSLADTARLLRLRGEAMQRAVPEGEGAMAAILGLSIEQVEDVASSVRSEGICVLANDNCPGQSVISGEARAVEAAIALASEKGAKRSVKLPVSIPSHCPLMASAARELQEALFSIETGELRLPLVFNASALPSKDSSEIKALLIRQITDRVRFRESVQYMASEGVHKFIELGAGKVLAGIVKRIEPSAETMSLSTPADMEAFIQRGY